MTLGGPFSSSRPLSGLANIIEHLYHEHYPCAFSWEVQLRLCINVVAVTKDKARESERLRRCCARRACNWSISPVQSGARLGKQPREPVKVLSEVVEGRRLESIPRKDPAIPLRILRDGPLCRSDNEATVKA